MGRADWTEQCRRIACLQGREALQALWDLSKVIDPCAAPPTPSCADWRLAQALALWEEADRAAEAASSARDALEGLPDDPARLALIDLLTASGAFHEGDLEGCITTCDAGLARGERSAQLLTAQLWAQRAVANKHLGRRDDSLTDGLRALELCADHPHPAARQLRATLHNNIGVLLLSHGDRTGAVRHLAKALDEADQDDFRASVHLNLGRLLLATDPEGAVPHLEAGAALAAAGSSEQWKLRARESMALVRRQEGRLDDALAEVDPVVQHWRAIGAALPLASSLLVRGRIQAERQAPEAEADLREVVELADQCGSLELAREGSVALVGLLESLGSFEEACRWHRRIHELDGLQYDQARSEQVESMHAWHRVQQAERDLTQALERAEAASRAKTGFLAITSHELRTPLSTVLGYADMVLEDVEDGAEDRTRLADDVRQIRSAGQHLERLIDRILTLASLGDQQAVVRSEPIVAADLVRQAVAQVEDAIEAGGNRLALELDPQLEGQRMFSDPSHLTPLLQHLLDNAVAFTKDGRITVSASRTETELRLDVQDTGIGFDPATLHELLQPFRQTDMSYTRTHEGLGVGLTLCLHHCTQLGGTLHAESSPGEGSTFRVVLPWRQEQTGPGQG